MRDFQLPGRSTAYARRAMVASSHPLATLAALDVLRSGGTAADASVAASAVLCVVEPQSTGIGGDCWVLYAPKEGGVTALNASGWAPAAASVDTIRAQGHEVMPNSGAASVTVPGAMRGWQALIDRHGRKPMGELLQPAIRHARDGFVVLPRVAFDWGRAASRFEGSDAGRAIYLPGGSAPAVGSTIRLERLAGTLEAVAKDGAGAFYEGPLASAMIASLRRLGGLHDEADFAEYRPEWVEPISATYRGRTVYQCPPNGQGVIALLILQILESFDIAALEPNGAERLHLIAEATRLAFRDRDAVLADPRHAAVPTERLLSKAYAAELARRIDRRHAMKALPPPMLPEHKDTVYLCVVDEEGNACSFINSLYHSFGSGLVCPETGVIFHNRGYGFSLDPAHPSAIAPRKRPMHTIIPGMVFEGRRFWAAYGVMGGHYQPVGHAHMLSNVIDYGMDPQAALDAPRIMAYPGPLEVERGIGELAVNALRSMGHNPVPAAAPWGGGQMILADHERGVLVGGSDPRKDGLALGY